MRRTRYVSPVQSNVLVVGVDMAKRSLVATAQEGSGNATKPRSYACDQEGFEALVADSKRARTRSGAKAFVVAVEPTGPHSNLLAAWLLERGVGVYAVEALKTHRAKELYDGTSRKTDEKDAFVIADLCRRGMGRRWREHRETFRVLRCLSRRRQQLIARRRQVLNRIRDVLCRVFPELERLFRKLLSKTSVWLLYELATPAAVLAFGEAKLTARLRELSRGQLGEARATALIRAARNSTGMQSGAEVLQVVLRQYVSEAKLMLEQLCEIERLMAQALKEVPYAGRLLSIPGLGTVTVATLLGELGDLRDYRVAKQLIKMAGLDLVEQSSGEHRGRHRVSRRGRSYARQMLYMAALVAGRGIFAARRHRMVEVGRKPPRKAVVANACALLRVMHALVRDDVDFDVDRYANACGGLKKAA